jgi:hypothetical protein
MVAPFGQGALRDLFEEMILDMDDDLFDDEDL